MNPKVCATLAEHFGKMALHELVTATREFPLTARLDLQAALGEVLTGPLQPKKVLGIHAQYSHATVTFAQLLVDNEQPVLVAPLQYDDIDVGEAVPTRCLRNGLWLGKATNLAFCVLLMPGEQFGQSTGLHLEIAVPAGEEGLELTRRLLSEVERSVARAGSYRGKVLSLEVSGNFRGGVSGVTVHRLRKTTRPC